MLGLSNIVLFSPFCCIFAYVIGYIVFIDLLIV